MIDHSEFARLLTAARKARGMSQEDVAQSAEMSLAYYRNLEQGTRSIPLTRLAKLRRALELDVNPLLRALPVDVAPVVIRAQKVNVSHRRDFGKFGALGRHFVRARGQRDITLASLATAVGISITHITRIESGRRAPSLALFAQLQRVLDFDANVVLDSLLERSSSNEPFHGFGAVVRSMREALGMTIAQVADAVRCTEHEYEQIERGSTLPTMTTLVHLHRVLRFDVATALCTVWTSRALKRLR